MILAVPEAKAEKATKILKRMKEPYYEVGRVVKQPRGRKERVIYK
jgi:phosphoribosylaminoimidazole (AIR) synthetase